MKPPILSIKSLSTGYGSKQHKKIIAQGLTSTLPSGSFTALIGVNGAGKSTLLRTLAGLQPALAGDISWLGKPIADYSRKEWSRTISIVLTNKMIGDNLRVRDIVEMGRMPYTTFDGKLSKQDHIIVNSAMEQTGCDIYSQREFNCLSDGERQRVMIAKALAQETPVILLDEPTAFLDYPSKVTLLRLLKRLSKEEGKTILLSTHDLELSFQIAEQLWLLSPEGLIVGTPKELALNGTLQQFFQIDGLTFDATNLRFQFAPSQP